MTYFIQPFLQNLVDNFFLTKSILLFSFVYSLKLWKFWGGFPILSCLNTIAAVSILDKFNNNLGAISWNWYKNSLTWFLFIF